MRQLMVGTEGNYAAHDEAVNQAAEKLEVDGNEIVMIHQPFLESTDSKWFTSIIYRPKK